MWKRAKSEGRKSRPNYECGSMCRVHEEFQNQTMNVEAYEEFMKNFKISLRMQKCEKNAGRISIPDTES